MPPQISDKETEPPIKSAKPQTPLPTGQLPPPAVQTPLPAAQPAAFPVPRRGPFILNFDDADVYTIIQTIFGEALRVNYVVDPRVKGRVTFRAIAPVPMENVLPLMEVILRLNDIGIIEDKDLYRIVPISDIPKRKSQVFVYQLRNSKAKDIASLLQQIYMGSKPAAPERTSTRSRTGQVTPAASSPASPLTSTGSLQPHVSMITTGGETLVADFTRIIPDEITNTVIILSTPEDYTAIKKTIEDIDIVPRQVVIEGMVASVSLTDNLSFGIAALFKGNVFNLDSKFLLNANALNVDPTKLSLSGFTAIGVDSDGLVRALVTALATESKAKVLAAPHILVSDNRDAKIQVGQQVPLITSETYGTVGVSPVRNFQYRDIGIILKVKPRINAGGLVSLELYQEISTYETIRVAGSEELLLNKTDVTTELVVQDNQTIVIGGLIREDTSKSRTGIPFLSKIPILGWLFGGTEDETKRQEIIILLTPRVIKNQKEAKDVSSEFVDKMSESSKGRIKKEELIKEKQQKQEGVKPSAN